MYSHFKFWFFIWSKFFHAVALFCRVKSALHIINIGMVQIKCLNVSLHIWIRFQEMSKIALINIWTAYYFSNQMKSRNNTCTFLLSSIQSWYVVLVILVLCRFSFVYRIHQCISDNSFTNCLPNQIILTFWKTASNEVQLFWEGH